jgi:hypothetical protein
MPSFPAMTSITLPSKDWERPKLDLLAHHIQGHVNTLRTRSHASAIALSDRNERTL